ncbi:hypothetical protein O3P69_014362 [Scylla paramamosain]|uniref:Secreted protein n=1 Tax=Scylla paramamosain TaxID=85552 RepID=A0AAW0TDL5_SCYPA
MLVLFTLHYELLQCLCTLRTLNYAACTQSSLMSPLISLCAAGLLCCWVHKGWRQTQNSHSPDCRGREKSNHGSTAYVDCNTLKQSDGAAAPQQDDSPRLSHADDLAVARGTVCPRDLLLYRCERVHRVPLGASLADRGLLGDKEL